MNEKLYQATFKNKKTREVYSIQFDTMDDLLLHLNAKRNHVPDHVLLGVVNLKQFDGE